MNAEQSASFGAALARAVNRSGSGLPTAGWYCRSAPLIQSKCCVSPINHLACFHRVHQPREDGRLLCKASRELREGCKWARVIPLQDASEAGT